MMPSPESKSSNERKSASDDHCTTHRVRGHLRRSCGSDVSERRGRRRLVRSVDRDVSAKAEARGITEDPYTRVMRGVRPDTTGLSAIHNQAEFTQTALAISQPRHLRLEDQRRQGKGARTMRRSLHASKTITASSPRSCSASGALSSAFGDPVVEKKSHAACHSVAGDARLGRTAPPRLLGTANSINALIIVQRGWATPEADDRFVGRRHGPYPMDAGGVAPCRHRLRRRRPYFAVRCRPTMRSARPRAFSSNAAITGAANIGATKCACRPNWHGHRLAQLRRLAGARRHPRRRRALPAARCDGTALDARSGRASLPARRRIFSPQRATIRR